MRRWGIVAALVFGVGWMSAACGRQRAESDAESVEAAEAPVAESAVPEHFVFDAQAGSKTPGEARLEAFASYVAGLRAKPVQGPATDIDGSALAEQLERELARLGDKAEASVHARELGSGRVLFDHQGERPLNPASNHKLVTAAAALDLLGPDYRFETRVLRVGDRLHLVGEGDPSIDGDALRELASDVAARVELDALAAIVIDDSAFSTRFVAPGYDPEVGDGASYVAPSGALSLNFNTVEIVFHGKGEGRPGVKLHEASDHIVVDNNARFGSKPSTVAARSSIEQDEEVEGRIGTRTRLELRGTVVHGERVKLRKRVADPGLYAGGAFARMLARGRGPKLAVEFGRAPAVELELPEDLDELELPLALTPEIELVAVLRSEPVHVLVGRLLAFSNNFMAEQMLRTLGWRISGEPGDWDNGSVVLRRYWAALGNEAGAIEFENGSGLSERGRVASGALVELIAMSMRTQLPGHRLVDVLPTAGKSGTLGDRLTGTRRRVRAKTGTLDGVSALSGVVLDRELEPVIGFSIVINNVEGAKLGASARHEVEDRIVRVLLESLG